MQLMAEILLRSSLELETDSWELRGQNSDREKSYIFFLILSVREIVKILALNLRIQRGITVPP